MTKISPRWSKLALSVLGDKEGRHCHWCAYINCHDGIAECENSNSPFCDGARIRTWDGLGCASSCPVFELDKWYTDDSNYENAFKKKEVKRDP